MVNGTRASELRTRFWPMRLTYSVMTGIGDQPRLVLHLSRELAAQRHLAIERIEIETVSHVALPDQRHVILGGQVTGMCFGRRRRSRCNPVSRSGPLDFASGSSASASPPRGLDLACRGNL